MIAKIFPARFTDGPHDGATRQIQGVLDDSGRAIWPHFLTVEDIGPEYPYPEDTGDDDPPIGKYVYDHASDTYNISNYDDDEILTMTKFGEPSETPNIIVALAGLNDLNIRLTKLETMSNPKLIFLLGISIGIIVGQHWR